MANKDWKTRAQQKFMATKKDFEASRKKPKTKVTLSSKHNDPKLVLMQWAGSVSNAVYHACSKSDSTGWDGKTDVEYRLEYLDWQAHIVLKCNYCAERLDWVVRVTEKDVDSAAYMTGRRDYLARSVASAVKKHRTSCKQKKHNEEKKSDEKYFDFERDMFEQKDRYKVVEAPPPESEKVEEDDKYPAW
jgi:hypothetical protein